MSNWHNRSSDLTAAGILTMELWSRVSALNYRDSDDMEQALPVTSARNLFTILSQFPFLWRDSPTRNRAASFLTFLDHTQWHNTVGRSPLDKGSARHRDYLTTQHSQKTNNHAPGGIRTRSSSTWATADPRLRVKTHIQRSGAASSLCFNLWKQIDPVQSTN
jgi:hypothetical protein